jgi:arsenate reductase (thioredoxin)
MPARTMLATASPDACRDDWPLEDPKGKPTERVRELRDEVERRVRRLLIERGWLAEGSLR